MIKTNRIKFIAPALLTALIVAVFYFQQSPSDPHPMEKYLEMDQDELMEIPKYDRPDLAVLQDFEMTRDPKLGYPPNEKLLSIGRELMQPANRYSSARSSVLNAEANWVERGPNNFGGRTRAIMFDPNDPFGKKVWAAGVAGGLWVNEDITLLNSEWTAINDFFGNIAINAMASDPSSPNVFYFGTGEGWFNADAVRGNGIWRSLDGGETWDQLASTNEVDEFRYVQNILVTSSGTVLAATRNGGGIYRSTDQGDTWENVVDEPRGADLEIVGDVIYASTGIFSTGKLWKSVDDGLTWSEITPATNLERIEIGTHPNHPNTIYAVGSEESTGVTIGGFFRSFDQGETWESITVPRYTEQNCTTGGQDFARSQAWYDLIIAVDPTDRRSLIVGGIDLYKTSDGGENWDLISYWVQGRCDVYVHADQHNFLFRPGFPDEAIAATDGGIYYTKNFSNPISSGGPFFEPRNLEFNVAQFYSCAMENEVGSNYFLGGTQDNGSHQFFDLGINSTNEVTGGDGSFAFIDQDNSDFQITSATYNTYFITKDFWQSGRAVQTSTRQGRFINPADYNNNTNTLFAAGNQNTIVRYALDSANIVADGLVTQLEGETISAIEVSPFDDSIALVGTGSGSVFILTDIYDFPQAIQVDSAQLDNNIYISSVTYGADRDHFMVTASNYGVNSVYETIDGGSTWTIKEGNLPDIPVRWILPNPNNYEEVLLATELGVWYTSAFSDAEPTWTSINNGLANVRCDMLQYREADGLVLLATHGRGMYTSDIFVTTATAAIDSENIGYTGSPFVFTSGAYGSQTYAWDFGDGNSSTTPSPEHTYQSAGTYLVTLQINDDPTTLVEKEVRILDNLDSNFGAAEGGDFETNQDLFYPVTIRGIGFELGSSSVAGKTGTNSGTSAWVTGIDEATYEANGEVYLYTPLYDFGLSGEYTISFFTKYEIEDGWEGFTIEYTTNFGRTWNKLGDFLDEQNWYNQEAITSAIAWTPGEFFFSGSTDDTFIEKSVTTSELSANDVGFRFVFRSDPGTEEAGIVIDDFTITPPSNSEIFVDFTAPSQNCQGQVIEISNNSTGTIQSYSWDFGPNASPQTAEGFGPHEIIFSQVGTQSVTLTAETAGGTEVVTKDVEVAATPTAIELESTNLDVCLREPFNINVLNSVDGYTYALLSVSGDSVASDVLNGNGGDIAFELTLDQLGSFDYKVQVNSNGCEIVSNDLIIVTTNTNPQASIAPLDATVLAASAGESYQWFLNGEPIEGAVSRLFTVTEAGTYTVEITTGICVSTSPEFEVEILGVDDVGELVIYPSVVSDRFYVNSKTRIDGVAIYTMSGTLVKFFDRQEDAYDVNELVKGLYIVRVESNEGVSTTKLMKE